MLPEVASPPSEQKSERPRVGSRSRLTGDPPDADATAAASLPHRTPLVEAAWDLPLALCEGIAIGLRRHLPDVVGVVLHGSVGLATAAAMQSLFGVPPWGALLTVAAGAGGSYGMS